MSTTIFIRDTVYDLDATSAASLLAELGSAAKRATLWHEDSVVTVGNPILHVHDAGQDYANYAYQNTQAINDTFTQGFLLAAGTYTFEVLGYRGINRAAVDWYIDGVLVISAMDLYNAVGEPNYRIATPVVVSTSGWHVLKGIAASKNPASTAYFVTLTKMAFIPAAD